MEYLLLSDIHSNIEALESVLKVVQVREKKIDKYVLLGDVVGYGASPNEIIDLLKTLDPLVCIQGNHDRATLHIEYSYDFNQAAREAILWTVEKLTSSNKLWLSTMPEDSFVIDSHFDIMHGTIGDTDTYIMNEFHAYQTFQRMKTDMGFYGHTHLPLIFSLDVENYYMYWDVPTADENRYELKEGHRYLINPGSVGQPRDSIPKASFGIYSSSKRTVEVFRVEYDIEKSQEKIRKAGLPESGAARLTYGR